MTLEWNPRACIRALTASVSTLTVLAFALVAQAQQQPLGEAQQGADIVISNSTGPAGSAADEGDSAIPMMVRCDGAERRLDPQDSIGCENTRSVSLTPLAENVRMRVSSGDHLQAPVGQFVEGGVTFATSPTNPDCDPDYRDREDDEVRVGGRMDSSEGPDGTDLQERDGSVEFVTVRHVCSSGKRTGGVF